MLLQYVMSRQCVGDSLSTRRQLLLQMIGHDNAAVLYDVDLANSCLIDVSREEFTTDTPLLIDFLLNECGSKWAGWACCVASQRGHVETAAYLVDKRGVSPFHAVWGAADGSIHVLDFFLERYYDMDAAKNISSMEGKTLLHEACTFGNHDIVGHLIRLGVHVNTQTDVNDGHRTPLDYAEFRWYDGMDDEEEEDERRAICIDILLTHGAVRGVDLPTPATSSDDDDDDE
jgi:hypothetical protein